MKHIATLACLLLASTSFALDDIPIYLDVGGDSAGIPGSAAAADGGLTLPTVGNGTAVPLTHTGALDGTDAIQIKIPSGLNWWNYGIKIPTDRPQPIRGYTDVRFWAKNNASVPAVMNVKWQFSNYSMGTEKEISIPVGANKWQEIVTPLSQLGPVDTSIAAFYFNQASSKPALDLLIDSLTLTDGTKNGSLTLPARVLNPRPTNWPTHFVIGGLDKASVGKATKEFQAGSDYRYQYVMEETFGYWSPSAPDTKDKYIYDYAKESQTLGVKTAFVWYNLGKSGEGWVPVTANLASKTYMDKYYARYDKMLTQMVDAGQKDYIIVLEPDMYGFLMRGPNGANGLPVEDPTSIPVNMDAANALSGKTFAPNFKGWAEFMVTYARTKLKDNGVVIGHMPNHWGVNIPGQVGRGRREAHLIGGMTIARFISALGEVGKGDAVFVEKTDYDAGIKGAQWFWDSTCYAKFFTWTKAIAHGTGLPMVGWQMAEGNTKHATASKRDDIVETFLDHSDWWIDGGFIGILFGGGNPGCANYDGTDDAGWYTTSISAYNKKPLILPEIGSGTAIATRNKASSSLVLNGAITLPSGAQTALVTVRSLDGRTLLRRELPAGSSLQLPRNRGLQIVEIRQPGQVTCERVLSLP